MTNDMKTLSKASEVHKLGYESGRWNHPEKYRSIWWTTNKDNKRGIIFRQPIQSSGRIQQHDGVHYGDVYHDKYGDRGWVDSVLLRN